MKEYLAICDLDGTLFDTDEVNYMSYSSALRKYDIDLDRQFFYRECRGKHYKEFLPMVIEKHIDLEEVHAEKKSLYSKYLNEVKVNYSLFRILDSIRDTHYLAVVTTASRKNTYELLEFCGYNNYFDMIITQDDIENIKPDPEGFLLCMSKMGIDNRHTLIFEDSEDGVVAAKKTGASVLIVNQF